MLKSENWSFVSESSSGESEDNVMIGVIKMTVVFVAEVVALANVKMFCKMQRKSSQLCQCEMRLCSLV